MSEFRKSNSSEESDNDSGEEETAFNRILRLRPKAVPKRRYAEEKAGLTVSKPADQQEQIDGIQKVSSSTAAGHLWSETVMMQSLEEKAGSGTIAELRDRGSETYALALEAKPKMQNRKRRRYDDIADSLWDQPAEEKKDDSGKAKHEEKEDNPVSSTSADPAAELWEGVDTRRAERPAQQRNRKQQHPWKRFRPNQKNWNQKRPQQQRKFENKPRKMIPAEKFVPHKLIAPTYDQKKLLEAEFDSEALSEEELVKGLVDVLGEQEPDIIRMAVQYAGKALSVELFKKSQETEKRGGMLTKKGNRRRTPGGVYLQHFKDCDEVAEADKKKLFAFGSELQRKSGNTPKWWDKQKQKKTKNGKKPSPSPEIEIESLPSSSEIFKPTECALEPADPDDLILELPVDD